MQDHDFIEYGTQIAIEGRMITVNEPAGFGGFSTVYRVTEARKWEPARTYALKVLKHLGEAFATRFENEARLMHALRETEGLIYVYAHGRLPALENRPFMLMELLEGPTLQHLAAKRELSVERACWLVTNAAFIVERLHRVSIVHRDIKPANLMVQERSDVRLLDLGFAHSPGTERLPRTIGTTDKFLAPGTPYYMAPEQARGEPAHPSFDLYALAITLYEALFGAPPFGELTPEEALARRLREGVELPEAASSLPASLREFLARGLQVKPKDRLGSAHAFRRGLEEILARDLGFDVGPRTEDQRTADGTIGTDVGATVTIPAPIGRLKPPVIVQPQRGKTSRVEWPAAAATMQVIEQVQPADVTMAFEAPPLPAPVSEDRTEVKTQWTSTDKISVDPPPRAALGDEDPPTTTFVPQPLATDDHPTVALVSVPEPTTAEAEDSPMTMRVPAPEPSVEKADARSTTAVVDADPPHDTAALDDPHSGDDVFVDPGNDASTWPPNPLAIENESPPAVPRKPETNWRLWVIAAWAGALVVGAVLAIVAVRMRDRQRETEPESEHVHSAEVAPSPHAQEEDGEGANADEHALAEAIPAEHADRGGDEDGAPAPAAPHEDRIHEDATPSETEDTKAAPPHEDDPPRKKPTPKTPRPPKQEPERAVSAPSPDSPACVQVRADTETARRARDWNRVLRLSSKDASCWDRKSGSLYFRLTALMELGRYEECIKLGRGSNDPHLSRIAAACEKKLEG